MWKEPALLWHIALLSAASPAGSAPAAVPWSPSTSLAAAFSETCLTFRGGLHLEHPDTRRFGGLSAISVSASGERVILLSDYSEAQARDPVRFDLALGSWFEATLAYGPEGELAGAEFGEAGRLRHPDGRPIERSVEGIAGDGSEYFVSFDDRGAVYGYAAVDGGHPLSGTPRTVCPELPGFSRDGIEALTGISGGRLLAIHEGPGSPGPRRRAWTIDTATGTVRRTGYRGVLEPSGAATLPGGDIVVLERRFDGTATRVRLVRIEAGRAGGGSGRVIEGRPLLDVTSPELDNFEGIATFARGGVDHILLLSDDNGDWTRALEGENPQASLLLLFTLGSGCE